MLDTPGAARYTAGMEVDTAQEPTPLERLRAAVKRAGGLALVADKIGTPRTHLHNVLSGKRDLGKDTCAKLRVVLRLDPRVWVELLAPLPTPEVESIDAT